MDGIHIPEDVAEEVNVPADLDSETVGPYRFPNPIRRRIAAVIYGALAAAIVVAIPNSPGRWAGAAVALVLAAWHWVSAWPLNVSPEEALAKSAIDAPFPIGHVSAAIIFHGWRVRPRWHVVLYDSAEPPGQRALSVIDGVTGQRVGEPYVEQIPVSG